MSSHAAARPNAGVSFLRFIVASCTATFALSVAAGEPAPPAHSTDPLIAAALRHEHGDGIPRNAGRAAEMYCAGARDGNADAAYRLGWMYANGDGVERDDRQAAALFRHAASLGHELALQMPDATQSRDARRPLCLVLAPPAAVMTEAGGDGPTVPQLARNGLPTVDGGATASAIAARIAALAAEPRQSVEDQVLLAIARWTAAWSLRQVDRYLAAYAPDFQLPPGESRQRWEQQRRARITEKAWIDIKLRDPEIVIDGDIAKARFVQDYRSDKKEELVIKTLTLVKSGATWLIRQEEGKAPPSSPARQARK